MIDKLLSILTVIKLNSYIKIKRKKKFHRCLFFNGHLKFKEPKTSFYKFQCHNLKNINSVAFEIFGDLVGHLKFKYQYNKIIFEFSSLYIV